MFLFYCNCWSHAINVQTSSCKGADIFSIAVDLFRNLFCKRCSLFGYIKSRARSVPEPLFCIPRTTRKDALGKRLTEKKLLQKNIFCKYIRTLSGFSETSNLIKTLNCFHNNLTPFNVLTDFPFTTSETMRDYYW